MTRRNVLIGLAVGLWLAGVGVSIAALARYKSTPGAAAEPPPTWPAGTSVPRAPDRPTLLMFAHPRCPCTRASLAELGKLATRLGDRVAATVVFVQPEGTGADWSGTELHERARTIPGVELVDDHGGVEAHRFGSLTSGQVLLYGAGGGLEFAGGITAARGHEGDSAGSQRILDLVAGQSVALAGAPVFGCSLDDPRSTP